MEQIDAVEILPAMVAAAELFVPNNLRYHQNPKRQVLVDDGRHFLVRQDKRYDIITVNLSDPHLPGGSTLFHSEFYELVKQHLEPGGVLIQHVFGSEGAIVANTLVSAFPYTRFTRDYGDSYVAVASMQPFDAAAVRPMAVPEEALRQLQRSDPGESIRAPLFRPYDGLPGTMHSDSLATDDFPAIEFSWNAGVNTLFINE